MNRKEIDRKYARIRSLEQLRAERQRLDWMIESREEAIEEDFREVRKLFSWDYLSGVAISAIQPFTGGLLSGVQSIFSFFSRSLRKEKRKICR